VNDIDVSQLKGQVQHNCHISDANYGGLFSLCSLLLRLRDLYKWENGLAPWQEPEPTDLLEWIDEREILWESMVNTDFESLIIDKEVYDPFDVAAINEKLRPLGLIYGAGYATAMKPSFFLAELVSSRQAGELQIDTVGRELARDLFCAPAMRQGNQILARRLAMLFSLWDQILEMRPSAKDALIFAMLQHDLDARKMRLNPNLLGPELHRVVASELETWIYHEIGEAREDVFNGYAWHEIVSTYSNTPIEIFARVIKDLLADTHEEGLLGHIIRSRKNSSVGFYITFMRPFTKLLFPEVLEAFKHFQASGDWELIEEARRIGYQNAQSKASLLVTIHRESQQQGVDWAKTKIIAELIEPLGFLKDLEEEE
jgi:hypothetical protein